MDNEKPPTDLSSSTEEVSVSDLFFYFSFLAMLIIPIYWLYRLLLEGMLFRRPNVGYGGLESLQVCVNESIFFAGLVAWFGMIWIGARKYKTSKSTLIFVFVAITVILAANTVYAIVRY